MRYTTRTTRALMAGISLPIGAAIIGAAALQHTPTQAVAGLALILAGITSYALNVIDRAVRDTSHERANLQEALKYAHGEHMRYLTLSVLVDREASELCQKMEDAERKNADFLATEVARLLVHAANEREELLADVEDRKAAIKNEGWQLGFEHGTRGITLEAPRHTGAVVIQMPSRTIGSNPTAAGSGVHLP